MSPVDLCDPVESYVRPIRSVLFVDDQFPTFAEGPDAYFSEADRARALWRACTERGWLCDVDNSSDWTSSERKQRLAACDLLVLDYHLVENDSSPTLSIIHDLARSPTPNIVVVYTKDPNPADVFLAVASWARGVSANSLDVEISEDLENLEDLIEWSASDLISFLSDKSNWKGSIKAACEREGLTFPGDLDCVTLVERRLRSAYGTRPSEIRSIQEIGYGERLWLQCENLFLVVVSKPTEQEPSLEATTLIGGLEEAVRQWAPSWLACLVAGSRRHVEIGAFRDDALLPESALQAGLLGHICGTDEEPERLRRATEIATHLLSRRFEGAAESLGRQLLVKATTSGSQLDRMALLHLNAFLCSEPFTRHHLLVGTIFAEQGQEPQYWICVTPACDMVPRTPIQTLNPWAAQLDPYRPALALRLSTITGESKINKALKEAEQGRHLFFWDRRENANRLVVAACFQTTSDPNPQLEQMFAGDRARVSGDGRVTLYRCVQGDANSLALTPIECVAVAQLRAPYSERIVHIVGGHLSRIGVAFVRLRA